MLIGALPLHIHISESLSLFSLCLVTCWLYQSLISAFTMKVTFDSLRNETYDYVVVGGRMKRSTVIIIIGKLMLH